VSGSMVEVQTFIDELKGIMKYYKVSKYQDTLDQIESLVAKYETIIKENERDNNEHNG
tara:strand:+ start:33 stop:206 length:174 start_codon:yes stop_codon:yes gene_type:complete